jgi:PAS domain S-box-containing protein
MAMSDALEINGSASALLDDRQYRLFLDSVTDYAICLLDPDGLITTWNPGAERLTGFASADILGRNFSIFYTPEAQAIGEPGRTLDTSSQKGRFESVGWRVRKDRSRFWANVVVDPIRDGGQIVGYAKITQNITARSDMREALCEAQAANQAIFDNSLDIICTITNEGLFKQVSRHAATVWGYCAQELIGRSYFSLVHPDDRESSAATAHQVLARGSAHSFRNRCIHKDGSIIPIAWSAAWSDHHGAAICIARDMRENAAIEETLRQAQRLEAVGRLTGGVAHDFNNLLTVIIGSAEMLLDENVGNLHIAELAQMIRSAGERGSELTSHLLSFARRQPLEPRAVQVNDLLKDMGPLLRRTLGDDVELRVVRDDNAWPVMADPAQLESAVLNLSLNARDAMPSGGKLTIETLNVFLDQTYCDANHEVQVGDYLMVAVSDNGEGMSAPTIQQVFEPFFTTKAIGKGTGMGLSMVYGFAKQSKGNVKIYSELGFGTTIKLYLPRADLDLRAEARVLDDEGLPVGTEHILLVEDDEPLREHAREQLQRLGYRVSVAPSGQKALELLKFFGDFDLLFTDVVMPGGLNGRQLADRIRTFRPELKVLFTSGYTEDALVHNGRLDEGVDLLNKPYRKRDLALKLRKVLDT